MGDIVETRQNELKTKKICRFCLTQNTSDLSNIYSRENRMKNAPLPLQVMACVSIEVFSNDGMPGFVCNECRLIFDYCYRFKQMCKKADTCLRHYPLTGLWSPAMDKPRMPSELLRKHNVVQKNLNALQIPKVKDVPAIIEEIVVDEDIDEPPAKSLTTEERQITPLPVKEPIQKKQQSHRIELEIEDTDIDFKYTPKKAPVSKTVRKTPVIKILNKSAIRILNKEAQKIIEPVMTKPVLKRDDDGNLAIVTQILEPEEPKGKDSIKNAEVLETNVFPCPHCERSFPLRQLLDIHMVNHNRERSFLCEYCDKSFFSKYDLQKHHLTHTGEKPFKCVVCSKGFTRSTLLHRHEKIHIDIPKYICVFCEKAFISQEEMEKHTERHRKHRPYVCKICSKAFAFKQGLERHEIVHCRQQPFQCQYCSDSFSTPSKLSRHLTAHAGARPYPCKLCPKSYLLSHHLTRHMRSHKDGSGSYRCNDCQKTFSSRDDLIYHSAVHATQTMVCPLCKDAFEDIETVTEHVKEHAEGEAYACEFCDYIFMTAERLEDHTQAEHAIEMVAYDEDIKRNAEDAKKKESTNEEKNSTEDSTSNQEIDEVIEEFLYDEFPDDSSKNDKNVIIKEEVEWEKQLHLENEKQTSKNNSVESNTIGDEALNLMNIIEMNDADNEPPAKIKKIYENHQEHTKKVTSKITPLRRKPPTKPAPVVASISCSSPPGEIKKITKNNVQPPRVIVSDSSSSSPKENKEPTQQKTPSADKLQFLKSGNSMASPKTRQPTIQDALKAVSKSVSIKRIVTPEAPVTPKLVETTIKKSSPKVTQVETKTAKQSPNTRMLRKRTEASPDDKVKVKASPEVKKSLPKAPEETAKKFTEEERKNVVEMMIGDKKVKVQKIIMSKSQVAEMTRDGRIQMKEGTMILKKSRSSKM